MTVLSMHARRVLLCLLLLLFGCHSQVAQVGNLSVTENDLACQVKVSELYFPGSGQKYVALSQLIKGYLCLEVLRSLGHRVDDAALEEEARRIDRETQAPELLGKIKAIYQGDHRTYLHAFVGVVYGERVLYHEVFLPSSEIHKASREKADAFLQEGLRSPSSFPGIAKSKGLETTTLRISAKEGIRPAEGKLPSPKSPSEAHLEQAKLLIRRLSSLQPGQLCREVVEWPEGYQVLRLLRKEGSVYFAQTAFVPKRDYEDWFWEQAGKIPVKISDHALQEQLLKEVAWARRIHVQ